MTRPTVLIADDHPQMLWHVRVLLETDFDVVATVSDGLAAIEAATLLRPDLALLDISMPILNGLDTAARLAEMGSPCRVVLFSMHDDEAFIRAAEDAGARAYVLKRQISTHLIQALRHALSDNAEFLPPASHENHGRSVT